MIYPIYSPDMASSPNPLISWAYIFKSLSTTQFQQIYDELGFPVNPTDELRQLGHDFAIFYDMNLGNPVSETPSFSLLDGVLPTDNSKRRSEVLFNNTFAYLERLGYAKLIYEWGKHTSDYYKYEDVRQLGTWSMVLLKWAIIEQAKHPIPHEHELFSENWDDVLAKWTPIYSSVPPEPFKQIKLEPLPLSEEKGLLLRSIVFQYATRLMDFETKMEHLLESPKTSWEESMLRSGGSYIWLKGEGKFRTNLREWATIMDRLSEHEVNVLEQWGRSDTYYKLKTPLPIVSLLASNP